MYLLGQQFLAKSVEADELACQETSIYEAFCHQHDFADELKVWDHHGAGSGDKSDDEILISILTCVKSRVKSFSVHIRPEKSLQVLWELSPASVTWVQSDENSYCWLQINLLSKEMKPENAQTQLQISNLAHSAAPF